jgi:hypothetical protein
MHYERHHRKGRGIESRPRSPQTLHWHKSRVTWGAILANPTQPPPFLFRCEFLGRHRCPHKQIQSRRSKERKQVVLADLSLGCASSLPPLASTRNHGSSSRSPPRTRSCPETRSLCAALFARRSRKEGHLFISFIYEHPPARIFSGEVFYHS